MNKNGIVPLSNTIKKKMVTVVVNIDLQNVILTYPLQIYYKIEKRKGQRGKDSVNTPVFPDIETQTPPINSIREWFRH